MVHLVGFYYKILSEIIGWFHFQFAVHTTNKNTIKWFHSEANTHFVLT